MILIAGVDMTDYPHVPAAFINAIAEEGSKAEAIEFLQKQWNETCALRAVLKDAQKRLKGAGMLSADEEIS